MTYAAAGGTASFRDPKSNAKGFLFLDGVKSTEVPFTASTAPADYGCSADRLTLTADLYETTLTRIDR